MKLLLPLFLLTLLSHNSIAQTNVDSLLAVWKDENQSDTTRLKAINKIALEGYLFTQPDSAFYYAKLQYEFALKTDNKSQAAQALKTQGSAFYFKADYTQAFDYYRKSLAIYEEIGDKQGIGNCLNNIANIFRSHGDYPRAIDYYKRSLKIREEIGNKYGIASSLTNLGLIYEGQGNHQLALENYQKALLIFEQIGDKQGIAACLVNSAEVYLNQSNSTMALAQISKCLLILEDFEDKKLLAENFKILGQIYFKQGHRLEAMEQFQKGLKIFEEMGDKQGIAQILLKKGTLYNIQGRYQKAIVSCEKGLSIAKELGIIDEQREACACIYDSYKALGNSNKALAYHEMMLSLSDSLKIKETGKKLQQMEFEKKMLSDSIVQVGKDRLVQEAHQEEVRKKSRTRNIALGSGFFLLIFAGGLYSRMQYIRKSKAIIEKERDRSDNLLHNILPKEIAQELKEKGKTEARDYNNVSILFSDFKEFTNASAKLSAQELVGEINICFEAFDAIMEKYGIEKIKTIGDAYMAAGGLPVPSINSTKDTVLAALDMQSFIQNRRTEKGLLKQTSFEMRVGVHTGPVVAGVVGLKKFQYDIWGDTVNTASRIESNSEAGKVNISQTTFELLKADSDFSFISRGKIQAKGKGEIEMYFVSKSKPMD